MIEKEFMLSIAFIIILLYYCRLAQPLSNPRHSMPITSLLNEEVDILLLDCDGTIAETEKDMTLLQFNEAFKRQGLGHIQWDPLLYGELLKTGVSQFRFKAYFDHVGYPEYVIDKALFCQQMKLLKDDMFDYIWENNPLPPRPGILKLVDIAISLHIPIVVCSNSNYYPVHKICTTLFGPERMQYIRVIGGDNPNIKRKKPFPDIYNLALLLTSQEKGQNYDPSRCLVIEDSEVGLQAALAANMRCIVTPSYYTTLESFTGAYMVLPTLESLFL